LISDGMQTLLGIGGEGSPGKNHVEKLLVRLVA
jgi:hypothetical protein